MQIKVQILLFLYKSAVKFVKSYNITVRKFAVNTLNFDKKSTQRMILHLIKFLEMQRLNGNKWMDSHFFAVGTLG